VSPEKIILDLIFQFSSCLLSEWSFPGPVVLFNISPCWGVYLFSDSAFGVKFDWPGFGALRVLGFEFGFRFPSWRYALKLIKSQQAQHCWLLRLQLYEDGVLSLARAVITAPNRTPKQREERNLSPLISWPRYPMEYAADQPSGQ